MIVVTLLASGCPIQAIVHAYGLDERTVASWRDRAGIHCQHVHQAEVEQGNLDLVQVQAVAPYDGVYTIRIGEQTHAVGDAVTKAVLVRPATPDPMSEHTPSANPLGEHA